MVDTFAGLSGTVTTDGFCSDGCFQLGNLDLSGSNATTLFTN